MDTLIFRIITVSVSALVAAIIFEIIMRWVRKKLMERTNKGIIRRLINVFRIVFYSFLGIVELGVWGVNLFALLAGAGFLGIIIGLAVQQPLGNAFSGMYILISKLVREGDHIGINAVGSNIIINGTVHHIGFSHTEIIDQKGKLNIVPNNVLISSILIRNKRVHA